MLITRFIAGGLVLCSTSPFALELLKQENLTVELGGNFHYDVGTVSDTGTAASRSGLWRRQRLSLDIGFGANVALSAEFDNASNVWTDLFVSVQGFGPGEIYIGQFKQFFSLDQLGSSKRVLLVERSMSDGAFALARRMGVGYQIATPTYGLQISGFGRNLDDTPSTAGVSLRGWLSPDNQAGDVTHYGLALSQESIENDRISFSARPGTRFTSLRAARTPALLGAATLTRIGAEFGLVRGPWYVQAEVTGVRTMRTGQDFFGYASYVQLSHSFGGNSRGYKAGVFQAPTGTAHPIELGFRVDQIDLNDGLVRGGSSVGVGVVGSYWLKKDTRVMLNATHYNRSPGAEDPSGITLRLQWVF